MDISPKSIDISASYGSELEGLCMDISPRSTDISASYGSKLEGNRGRVVGVLAFSSFKYAASYIGREMVG